jgi:hypothetical protein
MAFAALANDGFRLGIGEILDALLGLEMHLDPEPLTILIPATCPDAPGYR